MGSGLKIAIAGLLVCAVGGAATASAAKIVPKRQPLFRVTIKSTYVNHAVITVVEKPAVNGCRQRYDLSATQSVDVATTAPVLRTAAQLKTGIFPPMTAHENRTGSERNGWEVGCPALVDDPAEVTDTSECGARSYAVTKPSLGYLSATGTRFAFRYTRIGADPYEGNCMAESFDDPDADTDVSPITFPPDPFGTAAGTKPFWVDLNRARLTAGKTITLHWNDTATVSAPYLVDDGTLDQNVTSNTWTVSWDVTLVPVKTAKK